MKMEISFCVWEEGHVDDGGLPIDREGVPVVTFEEGNIE